MTWEKIAVAEVAYVSNGKTPPKIDQRTTGNPVLKIRDVDEDGNLRGPMESFVDSDFAERHPEKILQLADTLILNAAHNADYVASKTYRVGPRSVGALATGEWLILRPRQECLDTGFAYHWINASQTRAALKE